MEKCIKCKNYEKEIQGCLYMDADCKNGEKFEPITNYDHIKSMSVEEMAKFIAKLDECEKYCAFTKHEKCNATGTDPFVCVKGCKQWLLQEVSEDER